MAVLLDTSAIAPRDRIAAIYAAMTDATVQHTITHEDPRGDVHARMDYWQLGAANLFRHESSGICHTRTPRQLKIAAPERIALIVHQGGPGTFRGRPRLVLRRRHPLQPAVPRRLRHVAKGRAPAQPAPEPLGRRTSGHSPGQLAGVIEGAEPRGAVGVPSISHSAATSRCIRYSAAGGAVRDIRFDAVARDRLPGQVAAVLDDPGPAGEMAAWLAAADVADLTPDLRDRGADVRLAGPVAEAEAARRPSLLAATSPKIEPGNCRDLPHSEMADLEMRDRRRTPSPTTMDNAGPMGQYGTSIGKTSLGGPWRSRRCLLRLRNKVFLLSCLGTCWNHSRRMSFRSSMMS
jgi:hypothetical protein